jgi:D-glycero-D-manno-heptose 1,7-bisphosphate phosphatase
MQQNGSLDLNMRRAVFLDRDGVINETKLVKKIPTPPRSLAEIKIIEGVVEAVQIILDCKLLPVVITNQPDVARGTVTKKEIEVLHDRIAHLTGIRHFYTCFHDDKDNCKCRKPKPGLVNDASKELDIAVEASFLVGDRWRDVALGQSLGCQTFFIDYSYPEIQPKKPYTPVSSLLEAMQIVRMECNETR